MGRVDARATSPVGVQMRLCVRAIQASTGLVHRVQRRRRSITGSPHSEVPHRTSTSKVPHRTFST